jgi:putative tricarboxylic transport membrane protein
MFGKIISIRIIFSFLVFLGFSYAAYEARNYMFLAKVFPMMISLIMMALSLVNLIQDVHRALGKRKKGSGGLADLEVKWNRPISQVWAGFGAYLGLLLLLYAAIWFLGYAISITVFIFLFYWRRTGAGLFGSAFAAACALGFISLLDYILVLGWPIGVIDQWLQMPWPLGEGSQ